MKKILLIVCGLIVVFGAYTYGTKASFTSRTESVKNTFEAGTLKVGLDGGDFNENEKLQIKIIQPGKEYGTQKRLQIINKGTLDFQYAVTVGIDKENKNNESNSLEDKLMVQIITKEQLDSNKVIECDGEKYTVLYDGLVTSLKNGDIKGVIKSENSKENIKNMYLYFYLPEYVDFNYQNKTMDIEVNTLATQITK